MCRNVLIYMNAVLQRKLIAMFHYALHPDGHLVLGHAESVGAQAGLFTLVDKKHPHLSQESRLRPGAPHVLCRAERLIAAAGRRAGGAAADRSRAADCRSRSAA